MSVWPRHCTKAHHRPVTWLFLFSLTVRSWLSFTHLLVTTRRSRTREMRFILSLVEKESSSTASSDTLSRWVRFCSFQQGRFIDSRSFHPISRFGLRFMDRKEASRVSEPSIETNRDIRLSFCDPMKTEDIIAWRNIGLVLVTLAALQILSVILCGGPLALLSSAARRRSAQ